MSATKFFMRCIWGCLILTNMLQSRAAWAELAPFNGIGGSGGAPFRVDCGESGVLVGVIGRSGTLIDQVGGLCVHIDPFFGTWVGGVYETPHFGGNGGAPFRKICPVGQAVMGIAGSTDTIGGKRVVASLNLLCIDLGISQTLDPWKRTQIMGTRIVDINGDPDPNKVTLVQDYCDPPEKGDGHSRRVWGHIGLALEGSSGTYVDRVHLVCGSMGRGPGYRIEVSSNPTNPVPAQTQVGMSGTINSVPEGTPLRISWRASGVKPELIPSLEYSWELYDHKGRVKNPCVYALQPCASGWFGSASGSAVTFNSLPPEDYELRLTAEPAVRPKFSELPLQLHATTWFRIAPNQFIGTFAKTPPNYQPLWIYGIRPNGELIWYRKDSNASAWQGPKTVGTGWNSFKDVIPAGGNCFFALTQDGKLLWYRHDGFNEGSFTWPKQVEVGNGWAFARIFSGGQGIVYAIQSDGTLLWYRNNDSANGSREWQGPKVVGSAWNQFKDVFSTGAGLIYAVRSDGRLSLYQHRGYLTGDAEWLKDRVVATGWNSFKQIIPSSEGVIMGILSDGKMVWYKHLGMTASSRLARLKETWEGPVELGSGWQGFQKVIALIPNPPAAVR